MDPIGIHLSGSWQVHKLDVVYANQQAQGRTGKSTLSAIDRVDATHDQGWPIDRRAVGVRVEGIYARYSTWIHDKAVNQANSQ